MTRKIILIAGLGYVGSALATHLRNIGHNVVGLTRREPLADQRQGDLTDLASLQTVAQTLQPDFVVHSAASGRGGGEAEYEAVYRKGAENLLTAFPRSQLLYTSSTSVYPHIDGAVVTEATPAEPTRGTGKILRQAENLVLAAGGTVARLAGIYGPGRSVLLRNFLEGKSVIDHRTEPPQTPDGRFINQVHRQDILSGLAHLLELPAAFTRGQIFNICDSGSQTQRQIYTEMSRRFQKPLPPTSPPAMDRKRGWSHKIVSNARLMSTGWQPQYPDFFAACDRDAAFLPSIFAQVSSDAERG
jgi:nucleoside-diphosphate-sugar epimerase